MYFALIGQLWCVLQLQLLSAALCTHYAVGDVRELGVGQLKRFIKTESAKIDARKHATSSVYYATAACLDSRLVYKYKLIIVSKIKNSKILFCNNSVTSMVSLE